MKLSGSGSGNQLAGIKNSIDDLSLVMRVDDFSSAVLTYFGQAQIGSISSSAVWAISRIDETTGLIETFADGNANFDNIWDNRLSLTYI